MLLEFSVTNFTSFQDTARLSMVSSQQAELKDDHTIPLDSSKKSNVSLNRLAALFGANASGKSNLFYAFRLMRNVIMRAGLSLPGSKRLRKKRPMPPHKPFAFNPESRQQPTSFESIFSIDETIYRYGFSYNESAFVEEWLYSTTVGQKEDHLLFARNKMELDEDSDVALNKKEYTKHISDTNLFLTILAELGLDKYAALLDFFASIEFAQGNGFDLSDLAELVQKEDLRVLSCLLQFADTGISGLTVKELPQELLQNKISGALNDAPDELKKLMEALEEFVGSTNDDNHTFAHKAFDCKFYHDVYEDGVNCEYHLSPNDESTGTLRYIAIISYMLDALRNNKVLLIDELDTSLHPLLVEGLIDFFVKVKSRGQLIFSSHCPFMFDQKKIRRDELWLVDKNNQGTSRLESAVEYKEAARGDGNLAKRYLEGKFGGIPYIQHHILSECVNAINASIEDNSEVD